MNRRDARNILSNLGGKKKKEWSDIKKKERKKE